MPPFSFSLLRARLLMRLGRHQEAFVALNALKARRLPLPSLDYTRALCFIHFKQPFSAAEALKEELRYFPGNLRAAKLLQEIQPQLGHSSTDATSDPYWDKLLPQVRPCTMLGEARLFSLYGLARQVCGRAVPGNFVECGVAAGGSSALLAAVIKDFSSLPRKLFAFDTFAGMPASSSEDLHEGQQAETTGWGAGTCAAPIDSLVRLSKSLKVQDIVVPVQGLFGQTLPAHKSRIGPIALLHMDGDWYESTRDILVHLWDQVQDGGMIQIDDYGYWDGCRKAVTEFAETRGLTFALQKIDETGVWMIKQPANVSTKLQVA